MIISIARTHHWPDDHKHSQNSAIARAHHGHTTLRKLFRMQNQLGESEAMFWQNFRSFWASQDSSEAILGQKIGLNHEHIGHEGSIQDFVILRKQIAILCSLMSKPLCIFSTRFAIDNSTFGADTFQAHTCIHGTQTLVARARAPVCPSLVCWWICTYLLMELAPTGTAVGLEYIHQRL